ncbi:hypothetical protein B5E80_05290 [Flavonifractor sp. An135]|nr:C45 family peptidase [Flavonifractor sp. An135]OUQ25201.1 hypothetical protein B5E80_05290 [Flavonifractor sp. An135]
MEQKIAFPVLELSGTPREIGRQHGRLAREQLDVSMRCYRFMFEDYSHITWAAARRYARTFLEPIGDYDPEILEEIRGVAEGSGYDLEDILALNVRSEIVLQSGQLSQGCTALALTPPVTRGGETWLAQNWDWKVSQRQAYVLLHIRQRHKPDLFLFTEAGIVGKLGFNSAGVGVCLNALGSDQRVEGPTVPLHIVLRGILNSATLSDAIQNVGRVHTACCANFLTASGEGQAISIEAGPGDFDVLYAEEGWIAHTNHFVAPRWQTVHDTGKMAFPDTFLRYGRVRQLLRAAVDRGPAGFPEIQDILRDHMGYPDAICRHEDPSDPPEKRMGTVFSIAMNLTRRELYLTAGNPCQTPYLRCGM